MKPCLTLPLIALTFMTLGPTNPRLSQARETSRGIAASSYDDENNGNWGNPANGEYFADLGNASDNPVQLELKAGQYDYIYDVYRWSSNRRDYRKIGSGLLRANQTVELLVAKSDRTLRGKYLTLEITAARYTGASFDANSIASAVKRNGQIVPNTLASSPSTAHRLFAIWAYKFK